MKNNAIVNNKQHINENCLMLPSEMSIQEVVKDCVSFGGADEINLLHLCFDLCTECDPNVVFDKNAIFTALCSKCFSFLRDLNVDKNRMLEAKIKLILFISSLFYILKYCMFRYFKKKILGPWNCRENHQKFWRWLETFFKMLAS